MAKTNCNVSVLDISPTGEGQAVAAQLGPELVGWRCVRFDYGGCNRESLWEGRLLLPPGGDPDAVVQLLMGMQVYSQLWATVVAAAPPPASPYANAAGAPALMWTHALPTRPGYYWYRDVTSRNDVVPQVVRVRDFAGRLAIGNSYIDGSHDRNTAEWAGPLAEPGTPVVDAGAPQ